MPMLLKQQTLDLGLGPSWSEYVTCSGAVQELFDACPYPDNVLSGTRAFKNKA